MKIPFTYSAEDSDYLTIPSLRAFCSENGLAHYINRPELISSIEDFASANEHNNFITQSWLYNTLKAGMKTCLLKKIHYTGVRDKRYFDKVILHEFPDANNCLLCEYTPTDRCGLVNYVLDCDQHGQVKNIQFAFVSNMLKVADTYTSTGSIITYPIFVDIDFDKGYCITRSKAITGLFKISNGTEVVPRCKSSAEGMMIYCEEIVRKIINYDHEDSVISKDAFKKTVFNILEEYTKTPNVIKEKIDRSTDKCRIFAKHLFKELEIPFNLEIINDALYDLQIFVEKYSSITYPDEDIFISDRMAYPIKFLAQDNEFTKIQETSNGYEDPLQRKKAFFDSKKSVFTDKKCDKICLCHKRLPNTKKYYGDRPYNVQIYLHGSFCAVKFLRFVEEDDIQYVLSRIIQLYNVRK